jgi:hypothetical protein
MLKDWQDIRVFDSLIYASENPVVSLEFQTKQFILNLSYQTGRFECRLSNVCVEKQVLGTSIPTPWSISNPAEINHDPS